MRLFVAVSGAANGSSGRKAVVPGKVAAGASSVVARRAAQKPAGGYVESAIDARLFETVFCLTLRIDLPSNAQIELLTNCKSLGHLQHRTKIGKNIGNIGENRRKIGVVRFWPFFCSPVLS